MLPESPWTIIGLLILLAVILIVYLARKPAVCPATITQQPDGSLVLSDGQHFADMNAFQQWWHETGRVSSCPLPILTGATGPKEGGATPSWGTEQTYATTPIYKVDDYEFSRIFGYERDGRMYVPRQDFNKIIQERFFDWADRPLTSDERSTKYAGLREGFTADGELRSEEVNRELVQRFGSQRVGDKDIDCKISRETKEVAAMVSRMYENDPQFEPVVTKVGPHHWEVNELKPRRRPEAVAEPVYDDSVVNTGNDAVDIGFQYREKQITDAAIDPYFSAPTDAQKRDPFYGPVPGMDRMFGPTFDHKDWTLMRS